MNSDRLSVPVRFLVCPRCGRHGHTVIPSRAGHGSLGQLEMVEIQPEVWSKEAAMVQVVHLVESGQLSEDQLLVLTSQILKSDLSPLEANVGIWGAFVAIRRLQNAMTNPDSEMAQLIAQLEALLVTPPSASHES